MATFPKPAEFAVPPDQYLGGLLEMASAEFQPENRREILLKFIGKNLDAAREILDAVTIATLAARLDSLKSRPQASQAPPEPAELAPQQFAPQASIPEEFHAEVLPEAEQQPEDEILGLVGDMREVALRFRGTLASDAARLEQTRKVQEENLSAVNKEQKRSMLLRSSGQLGYFCTLFLIAISGLLTALMIPFIIVTR